MKQLITLKKWVRRRVYLTKQFSTSPIASYCDKSKYPEVTTQETSRYVVHTHLFFMLFGTCSTRSNARKFT